MPESYTVKQLHLSLDLILWRRFGRPGQSLVEQTYVLNPGLAAHGPILPVGTVVLLPNFTRPATKVRQQPVDLFG